MQSHNTFTKQIFQTGEYLCLSTSWKWLNLTMNHHIKKSDSCNVHTDSFEVFMGAEIQVKVLWVVTLCNVNTIQCHNPADANRGIIISSRKQYTLHFLIPLLIPNTKLSQLFSPVGKVASNKQLKMGPASPDP